MSGETVITQVQAPGAASSELASVHELPETTMLNLRGRTFAVSRERLLSLPENILFGLTAGSGAYMPAADDQSDSANGSGEDTSSQDAAPKALSTASDGAAPVASEESGVTKEPPLNDLPPISPQSSQYESAVNQGSIDSVEEGEADTMSVDFNPRCFAYVLRTFDTCEEGVSPVPVSSFKEFRELHGPRDPETEDDDIEGVEAQPGITSGSPFDIPEVLMSRPAVIVLREDLEYYLLTKPGLSHQDVITLKEHAGDILGTLDTNRHIFSGLRNREVLDSPEYHLMQMLVLSGITVDQTWGFREHEPRQARVLSLQLQPVDLPVDPSMIENIRALQKLLLFWRKPAKKCWWDKFDIDLGTKDEPLLVTMHARRVWTLELSILGLTA